MDLERDIKELEFKQTLPIGEEAEKYVAYKLWPFVDMIKKNCDKDFDLFIFKDGNITTIEVKYDKLLHKTGNFFIECTSYGLPSGIKTTKSDLWVQVDANFNYYCIETDILKDLVKNLDPIQSGCKDSGNYGYLLWKEFFFKNKINPYELFFKG